jgi:hypothetical protein
MYLLKADKEEELERKLNQFKPSTRKAATCTATKSKDQEMSNFKTRQAERLIQAYRDQAMDCSESNPTRMVR